MGGTLAPFLVAKDCNKVLSVDDRERQQPDERGPKYDYAGITSQTMIENLQKNGLPTSKLETFDGSVENLPLSQSKFDLGFIDAEHTDEAVFRDFVYLLEHMKRDCVVMFHDSSLTAKGSPTLSRLSNRSVTIRSQEYPGFFPARRRLGRANSSRSAIPRCRACFSVSSRTSMCRLISESRSPPRNIWPDLHAIFLNKKSSIRSNLMANSKSWIQGS